MFRLKKLLMSLTPTPKPTGLCHNCFKSGVLLSDTYDILCVDCVPEAN